MDVFGEFVAAGGDFVKAGDGFFDADHVVDYFFVDSVGVVKLGEVDCLVAADYSDVGRVPGRIAKGDYHAAGNVEE